MKHIKKVFCILLIIFNIMIVCNFSNASEINTYSPVCLLMESSTGKILYEKDIHKKVYPASTTKLMTAILVMENCNLSDIATVNSSAIDIVPAGYSSAYLKKGENLTIEQLLHVLLIPSANDAANVLAEHVGGTIENFANMMNQKAKELGCKNTNFKNPSGIHDDNHYSTAYDLSIITKYAMQFQTIKDIANTTKYNLPKTNKYNSEDRIFYNTNLLLSHHSPDDYYYEYATGLKTGYTNPAKDCIIATAKKDDLELIAIILGADDNIGNSIPKYLDCKTLFEYGFNNYSFKSIVKSNSLINQISIHGGTKDTKNLDILVKDDINIFLNNNFNTENLISEIKLKENLIAPIKKGSVIGEISYTVDEKIYSSDLIAGNDVEIIDFMPIFLRISILLFVIFIIIIVLKRS